MGEDGQAPGRDRPELVLGLVLWEDWGELARMLREMEGVLGAGREHWSPLLLWKSQTWGGERRVFSQLPQQHLSLFQDQCSIPGGGTVRVRTLFLLNVPLFKSVYTVLASGAKVNSCGCLAVPGLVKRKGRQEDHKSQPLRQSQVTRG